MVRKKKMKKYLLLFILLLCCCQLFGQLQFSPYTGIGINFGFSTWNTPIPTLCFGGFITNWLSAELQLGTVGSGNQLTVNQKFHFLSLVQASQSFSCFFYGAKPFLTYTVNLSAGIPIFHRILKYEIPCFDEGILVG